MLQRSASVGLGLAKTGAGVASRVLASNVSPSTPIAPAGAVTGSATPASSAALAPYRTVGLQYPRSKPALSVPALSRTPFRGVSGQMRSLSNLAPPRSLRDPLPEFAGLQTTTTPVAPPETRVTTLPNGVRIATRETYGITSTIGAHLALGTADELHNQYGCAHLLERMSFGSTAKESSDAIISRLDFLGSNCMAMTSREVTTIYLEGIRSHVPELLEILARSLLENLYEPQEILSLLPSIEADHYAQMTNPEMFLFEALFMGAFGENTPLGHPIRCNPAMVEEYAKNRTLAEFAKTHLVGPRVVISACGVDHDEFVALATPLFNTIPKEPSTNQPTYSWESNTVPSPYRGGETLLYDDSELAPAEGEGHPSNFSHLLIAWEGPGARDPDFYAACVLTALLGGGSSFSSGGPGKGMYSRFYRRVLNRYEWMEHASCFAFPLKHTSLFGVYCKSDVGRRLQTFELMRAELQSLLEGAASGVTWPRTRNVHDFYQGIEEEECLRAKNSIKGTICQTLESRLMLFDEIGKRLVACGDWVPPEQICAEIDKLTIKDLRRVAGRILSSLPTVVGMSSAEENQRHATQPALAPEAIQQHFKKILNQSR